MATGSEVMKNFFKVLKEYSYESNDTGRVALDKAARAVVPVSEFAEIFTTLKNGLFGELEEEVTSDTRLQQLTGMVIGANGDLSVDTGAISGSNAGGSVVKNAQDIVPESGDLSTATLPTPGSTSQITYTGDDGKSFTFNVKWPDSFTQFVSGRIEDDTIDITARLFDSKFLVDLNSFDESTWFAVDAADSMTRMAELMMFGDITYGEMKTAAQTILKGLNTYWLRESAKLIYDSYGLDFNGKTISITFMAGGEYGEAAGITGTRTRDGRPADEITIGINLAAYGKIDATNPNGLENYTNEHRGNNIYANQYLDRVVAHEMVHAAMMASGTLKEIGMPYFFVEGVADLVQGDDDFNSAQTKRLVEIVNDSDTFVAALNFQENGNGNAYPAGDMLLRFMAWQVSDTTIFVGDESSKNQTIDYNGGDAIITNYDESNTINYNANFTTALLRNTGFNDFAIVSGNNNQLIMRDVRGKVISFAAGGKNAYAYMAENVGELDGRNFNCGNNYEIIFGANNKNNILRAGKGGSELWGGYGGNDELYGGAGVDTFVYDVNGGNDTIHDAESQDIVLFRNMTLDQISRADITDNGVNLAFTYGGTLNVEGRPTNFVIENDNAVYAADYQNKTWSVISTGNSNEED